MVDFKTSLLIFFHLKFLRIKKSINIEHIWSFTESVDRLMDRVENDKNEALKFNLKDWLTNLAITENVID